MDVPNGRNMPLTPKAFKVIIYEIKIIDLILGKKNELIVQNILKIDCHFPTQLSANKHHFSLVLARLLHVTHLVRNTFFFLNIIYFSLLYVLDFSHLKI